MEVQLDFRLCVLINIIIVSCYCNRKQGRNTCGGREQSPIPPPPKGTENYIED